MLAIKSVFAELKRRVRISRLDALRVCLQSLVASTLTYVCLSVLGSPNLTWGVFSSLFALQVHFDRSLKNGVGQILGACGGTVVGLAALHILPAGDEALLRLAFTTLITCLCSAMLPSTNYSIVVAAAIALEPSAGTVGAFSRAAAILSGSIIAIAVSISVWPQLGRSRTFNVMADLLEDCRALLYALSDADSASDRQAVDALHERFLRHLVDARAVSSETHVRARFKSGPMLHTALSALETLWHGLVLLDRVAQSHYALLPGEHHDTLMEHLSRVCECADEYLRQLVRYMRHGEPYPYRDEVLAPLRKTSVGLRSQLKDAACMCGDDHERTQALSALGFALEQIESNLYNIGRVLEKPL